MAATKWWWFKDTNQPPDNKISHRVMCTKGKMRHDSLWHNWQKARQIASG